MISFNSQNDYSLNDTKPWVLWLEEVVSQEGYSVGEVDYVFCSDDYLLELNQEFLNHDTLTDIIPFDNKVGQTVHGEIYISTDRVKENSLEYEVTFEHELARVLVHGVLHLCGYRDKTNQEQEVMRGREDYWINMFKVL